MCSIASMMNTSNDTTNPNIINTNPNNNDDNDDHDDTTPLPWNDPTYTTPYPNANTFTPPPNMMLMRKRRFFAFPFYHRTNQNLNELNMNPNMHPPHWYRPFSSSFTPTSPASSSYTTTTTTSTYSVPTTPTSPMNIPSSPPNYYHTYGYNYYDN